MILNYCIQDKSELHKFKLTLSENIWQKPLVIIILLLDKPVQGM